MSEKIAARHRLDARLGVGDVGQRGRGRQRNVERLVELGPDQHLALAVEQHGGRRSEQRGLRDEELAEAVAVVVEHRLPLGHRDRHRQRRAAKQLNVLETVDIGHRLGVVDQVARRQHQVDAVIERDAADQGDQDRGRRRDDREQADDADMEPRARPAAAAALHHRPDLAQDDAEQEQHGDCVDAEQADDDLVARRDRRQSGQHHEGGERRQERQHNHQRADEPHHPAAARSADRHDVRRRRVLNGRHKSPWQRRKWMARAPLSP
jgi:hypothetical protein